MKKNDKNITGIKVTYDDSSTKEIEKGVVAEFENDKIHMDMLKFGKYDMVRMTYALLYTLKKLGLEKELDKYVNGHKLPDEE